MRLIDADVFKRYIMNGFYDSEHLFKKKETRDVAKQMAEAIRSEEHTSELQSQR